MPKKMLTETVYRLMRFVIVLLYSFLLFSAGAVFQQANPQISVIYEITGHRYGVTGRMNNGPVAAIEALQPVQETWGLIHAQYSGGPIEDQDLVRGAIHGMLEALGDPHSGYVEPARSDQAQIQLTGAYIGIGAEVVAVGDQLQIAAVTRYSPAEKAGLAAGDQILQVDGQPVNGLSPQAVFEKLLGEASSTVSLTILPASSEDPRTLVIPRDRIEVPSVDSKMLASDILLLRINMFSENTPTQVHQALQLALQQQAQGVILDLRDNGGGSLDAALAIAAEFLGEQPLLIEHFIGGRQVIRNGQSGGIALHLPLVVLVNENSASSAEVLAGALQDNQRAPILGTRTHGKGTIQNWIPLTSDAGVVTLTIARWTTPNGRDIEGAGIEPDVWVQITPVDQSYGRDPQLEKAIALLMKSR